MSSSVSSASRGSINAVIHPTLDDTKATIFNLLKSRELDRLQTLLSSLDPLQKSKYLASTMNFDTQWALGEEKMTPLQYACFLENKGGVKLLIEQGASVKDFGDTTSSTQRGSLHFAIDAEHPEIALLLLENGAIDQAASCIAVYGFHKYQLPYEGHKDMTTVCTKVEHWTCLSGLHMSILKNMHQVVSAILTKGNAKIHETASGFYHPLHLAAKVGDVEMINLLIANGAQKNVKTVFGDTPQSIVVKMGHDHKETLLLLF